MLKDLTPKQWTAKARPALLPADLRASDGLKAARRALCDACPYNIQGICRQCCGGVPIETIIGLVPSRCGKNYW